MASFHNSKSGEIATLLVVGGLILLGVGTVATSYLTSRNTNTTITKAASATCGQKSSISGCINGPWQGFSAGMCAQNTQLGWFKCGQDNFWYGPCDSQGLCEGTSIGAQDGTGKVNPSNVSTGTIAACGQHMAPSDAAPFPKNCTTAVPANTCTLDTIQAHDAFGTYNKWLLCKSDGAWYGPCGTPQELGCQTPASATASTGSTTSGSASGNSPASTTATSTSNTCGGSPAYTTKIKCDQSCGQDGASCVQANGSEGDSNYYCCTPDQVQATAQKTSTQTSIPSNCTGPWTQTTCYAKASNSGGNNECKAATSYNPNLSPQDYYLCPSSNSLSEPQSSIQTGGNVQQNQNIQQKLQQAQQGGQIAHVANGSGENISSKFSIESEHLY